MELDSECSTTMALPRNSVFISYRRDDSAGWSSHLAGELRSRLGQSAVFIDASSGIPYGSQWPDQIAIALDQCRVFLPVIAPSWQHDENIERLSDPHDWVREELITAYGRRQSVLSIPVFVNEAKVLKPDQFSHDTELEVVIRELMRDQGINLDRSTEHWPAKIDDLVGRIKTHMGIKPQPSDGNTNSNDGVISSRDQRKSSSWLDGLRANQTAIGTVAGVVGAIAAVIALYPIADNAPADSNGNSITIEGDVGGDAVAGNKVVNNNRDSLDVEVIQSQQATIDAQQATIDKLLSQLSTSDQLMIDGSIRYEITDAVTGLSGTGSVAEVAQAEAALAGGDTKPARSLLKAYAETQTAANAPNRQEEAQAYRRWGALAYANNTDEALEAYQKAIEVWPEDIRAWNQLGHLHLRTGQSDTALEAFRTVAELADSTEDPQAWTAVSFANLGHTHKARDELDDALEMYESALVIFSELDRKGNMSSTYHFLGAVHDARGELDDAIAMYRKTLAIENDLGSEVGMAINYDSLSTVYENRGDSDLAVEMAENSLAMYTKLGMEQGVAISYYRLGNLYHRYGELDDAAAMYEKALALNIYQDHKKSMVDRYGHLAGEYQKRGQLGDAVLMLENALVLNTEFNNKAGIAEYYYHLGVMHEGRNDLEKAVSMYENSLAIEIELGSKKGMAINYNSLGLVQQKQGELDEAMAMYNKALPLNTELNNKAGIADNYANLGLVYEQRGELDEAQKLWELAVDLYDSIRSPAADTVHSLILKLR